MDYDDWLFDSIRKYEKLSMFDLQNGVTAVDLVDGKGLCVSTSTGLKHEICELLLPDKLLHDGITERFLLFPRVQWKSSAADLLQTKIKKDRDFRVQSGGFCPHMVTDVVHLPRTRLCAVAKKGGCASVWEMGNEDTDLMKEYKPIAEGLPSDLPIRMSLNEEGDKRRLAIGSCLNNIKLMDAETLKQTDCILDESKSQQISSCQFLSDSQLICCSITGNVITIDTRTKNCYKEHKNQGRNASYWTMSNCFSQSNIVLQMSSEGEVILLDKRNFNENVMISNIEISAGGYFEKLCIKQSPNKQWVSVSGFDGLVYLFNTKSFETQKKQVEPVFLHEGHVINADSQSEPLFVSKHLWHPWQKDLVISCGNDGSIQAWQWNEKVT